MKTTITRLWIKFLCCLSELGMSLSIKADVLAIGSQVRRAEKKALKSGDKKDADEFYRLMRIRTALMPLVCSTKQTLAVSWRQVQRHVDELKTRQTTQNGNTN